MTTYEIITRHDSSEQWTADGIESSPGSNRFGTEAEAEEAIEELKDLGTDWAEAEYDVRQVSDAPVADYVSKDDVSSWETVASYVATFPSDGGEGACDVSVQIGEAGGQWYLRTSDDAGGDDDADDTACPTREAAVYDAGDFADERNEAKPGEDAGDYLTRRLKEDAGESCADGKWCVYWETSLDDAGPRERYVSEDGAQAACDLANKALHECHPGGNLLCGFSVRELVDGVWEQVSDE